MSHPHGNDGGFFGRGDEGEWGGDNPSGAFDSQEYGGWSEHDGWNSGYDQSAGAGGYGNQPYHAMSAGGGVQFGPGADQFGSVGQFGPVGGSEYGPGGPAGLGGPNSPKKSNTGLIIGIAGGVVALIVVIAIGVAMLVGGGDGKGGGGGILGPSEEDLRQDAADGVNETMTSLGDFGSLVEWNTVVCEQYQGSEESLRAADGFLSFLGGYDALFDFTLDEFNVTADQVEFTNDERTEILVQEHQNQAEEDSVRFRYEEEAWKICDPDLDLRQFDDIESLGF